MKVFCKKLNPCSARSVNLKQYSDYINACGHTIVDNPEDADTVLIWGCGFRTDYQNNTLEQANYYREIGKNVYLGGCIPDINPAMVEEQYRGGVIPWREDEELLKKHFGGKQDTVKLNDIKMTLAKEPLCLNAEEYKKKNPDKDACYLDEHIRAYVSEGCKLTCSYCSEKLMFPDYNSYPLQQILDEVRHEIEAFAIKYPDEERIPVMLQADSVGDYGKDIGLTLPELIEGIIGLHDKASVGMQGFNPAHFMEYYEQIVGFIKRDKIFHLRLPIQNGNQDILEKMGRKYTVDDIHKMFGLFNEMNFKEFSTDIIIGFPGETESSFQETVDIVLKYKPKYILLSAYMDFERLPSYALPDKVDQEVKLERLRRASELFIANGIYCSTDGGNMTNERRRRMNADNRIM